MSLLLLIDGYNVIAPVAPPSRGATERWLQEQRMRLIARLASCLDEQLRARTCVVFDANRPPRDRPDSFDLHSIRVRFAVGYPEADDLIEELIAQHSSPRQLAVVSSDHRIQNAARRRGCAVFDSDPWFDDLLDGRIHLARAARGRADRAARASQDPDAKPGFGAARTEQGRGATSDHGDNPSVSREDRVVRGAVPDGMSDDEVEQWMRDFGF